MLTLALGATLVGFVLLILGLVTGTVWLAVACIVICLLGLGFLLVDVFASRGRENTRSLEDLVPGAARADDEDEAFDDFPEEADAASAGSAVGETGGRVDPSPTGRAPIEAPRSEPPTRGFEPNAPAGSAPYEPPPFQPGMADPVDRPGPQSLSAPVRPAPERREGTYEDYLRSVGGDADLGAPSTGPLSSPQHRSAGGGPQQGVGAPRPGSAQPGPSGPQRFGPPPQPGPGSQSGPAPQSGSAPRLAPGPQGGEVPSQDGEQPGPPSGRRRRPDLDPLDPNWKPPLED